MYAFELDFNRIKKIVDGKYCRNHENRVNCIDARSDTMIHFENDYTRGTHPRILKRLVETNDIQTPGYGVDEHCENAAQLIKKACSMPNADVHFIAGGTLTNLTIISSILRPHEAVVAPATGHIAVAETGAIEATGHKIITIPTTTGKITAAEIKAVLVRPDNVHSPRPGLIFISQSTEVGGIYNKDELSAIKLVADEFNVPLFIDGARLGYALAAEDCDLTLAEIASLTDIFYIGGTKVGALFGEAVVITNDRLKRDFRYLMKQRGALMAKGRILGLQFEELFRDNLYSEISAYAVSLAMKIKQVLAEVGLTLAYPATTNQLFIEFTEEQFTKISENYILASWERRDDLVVARLCTDWSTHITDVESFIADLRKL